MCMNDKKTEAVEDKEDKKTDTKLPKKKKEIGGADGPEPTRFGDWEKGNYLRLLEYLRALDQILMASNPLGLVLNLQIQKRQQCIQLSYMHQ